LSKQPKHPKTDLDKQFLFIVRQVLKPYGITSDRAISLAIGKHADFINHVSNGLRSVSPAVWELLITKYPEASSFPTSATSETIPPLVAKLPATATSPAFHYIINQLAAEQFEIPRSQPADAGLDFPAYLDLQLDNYITYYQENIRPYVDSVRKHGNAEGTPLERIIIRLTTGIKQSVKHYYEGKLLKATQVFHEALDAIGLNRLIEVEIFPEGRTFYRTRYSSERPLTRKELFHNPFENRGIVATNRYSIPGLPALYLGDSTYVCWEEYNRKDFRNLYFSRFCNTAPLKVVKIQRLPDLITQLSADDVSEQKRMTILARYLSLFPLSIACSIRTRSTTDVFKPEYIVPQLLLQYITDQDGKDAAGIMYPSTKVNYDKIQGVPAYNYVFPVKQIQSNGYCSDLANVFALTNPTSTELESLTHFSNLDPLPMADGLQALGLASGKFIAVADESSPYANTAFGFLERVLHRRSLEYITTR
jgi:hypothetical protein